MKIPIIILLLASSIAGSAQSLKDLTAKQILDSSIKFCGGETRIKQIKSSSLTYLITQPDKSTAIAIEKKRTGKKYGQSILSTQHTPQTTFFDGEKFARVNGSSLVRLETKEWEEIKLKTYDIIQYAYKAMNYELERLPDQKFQHFDCYVISASAENGYYTLNYFDKTNFRLLMIIFPNGNKSLMIEYTFKDSVLFNSHIINTSAGSNDIQTLSLGNTELNKEFSDLWFSCPYTDKVHIPPHIKTGRFESISGNKTEFTRTEDSQDYVAKQEKPVLKRFLKWIYDDTFWLINEEALKNNTPPPESQILVRIISWDKTGYVCHWIAGNYTDTQDYKIANGN